MRTFLLVVMMLVFTLPSYAHKAIGKDPDFTMDCVRQVESYFQDRYGLTLQNELIIYVTKTEKEYKDVLIRCGVNDAARLARTSYAVTSKNNGILINGAVLSKKHFFFILAHEMVHKYQLELNPNAYDDYVLLEGHADLIAEEISGYPVRTYNHGISYNDMKTREGFLKHNSEDGLEQVRYYASQIPFLRRS